MKNQTSSFVIFGIENTDIQPWIIEFKLNGCGTVPGYLVLYVLMVYIRGAVHIQIAPLVIVIAPLGGPRNPHV